tara:strand:- start:1036 stop:1521 length:486 start_codon:yes stop_codon:yes gene_type:complete
MKLKNVIKTNPKDWLILGGKIATRIVLDADNGISQDGNGKKFAKYKTNYAIAKKTGKVNLPRELKGTGTDRQVSPPNLRLTGTMLDSIKAQNATKTSVDILYADGLKVVGHSKRRGNRPKRNIYGLNQKNKNFIAEYFSKKFENNISKYVAKDIEIKLDFL